MARLLLIDDDRRFVEMLQVYFTEQGHTVDIGFDGQMALRSARAHAPDLLIMDFQMPMTHGGIAVDYIRRMEAFKKLPIIILSGAPEADVQKTLAAHLHVFYLKKPQALAEIHKTVEIALRSK